MMPIGSGWGGGVSGSGPGDPLISDLPQCRFIPPVLTIVLRVLFS